MMRRLSPAILLVMFALPGLAHAASWRSFHSRQLGVAFHYPGTWKLTVSNLPGNRQVTINSQSGPAYALVATVLAARPGHSLGQTMQRFVSYESSIGNAQLAHLHWSRAALGGKSAMVGIVRPSTEGGVAIANAILVTQWRSHIYEVTLTAYSKPAPSHLRQFPGVYSQILRSWRFL
jgi:hypothetical protein